MDDKQKVYVIWYDNNESYEDNWQGIEKVFLSYEDAADYLNNKGYTLSDNTSKCFIRCDEETGKPIYGERQVWEDVTYYDDDDYDDEPVVYGVYTYTIRVFEVGGEEVA